MDANALPFAFLQDGASRFLPQPLGVSKAHAQRQLFSGVFAGVRLQRAEPIGAVNVHRLYSQPVALRIFHDGRGTDKTPSADC